MDAGSRLIDTDRRCVRFSLTVRLWPLAWAVVMVAALPARAQAPVAAQATQPAASLSVPAVRELGSNVAKLKLCAAVDAQQLEQWRQGWQRHWQGQPDSAARDAAFQQGQDAFAAAWGQQAAPWRQQACEQARQWAQQLQGVAKRTDDARAGRQAPPAGGYGAEQVRDLAATLALVGRCKLMTPERIEQWRQAHRNLAADPAAFDLEYKRGYGASASRFDGMDGKSQRAACLGAAATASRLEMRSYLLKRSQR